MGVRHPAPTEALTPEPVLCKKSNHHSEKPAHHSWRKARAATTTQVSEKYINKILLKKKKTTDKPLEFFKRKNMNTKNRSNY